MNYKLGLDTGGTYTDAVLVDSSSTVVASAKALTTHHDLSIGLRGAITAVMPAVTAQSVSLVSLSTTLATNALVEGRGLPAALVLIGYNEKQLARARLTTAARLRGAGSPVAWVYKSCI